MAKRKNAASGYVLEIRLVRETPYQDSFKLNEALFSIAPENPISAADISVSLQANRFPKHIDVLLHFTGNVEVACDRCLAPLPVPLDFKQRLVLTNDAAAVEIDETELVLIPAEAKSVDLSQELYDLITLAVPARRVCEEFSTTCDPSVIQYLASGEELVANSTEVDPRWQVLSNFKPEDSERNV